MHSLLKEQDIHNSLKKGMREFVDKLKFVHATCNPLLSQIVLNGIVLKPALFLCKITQHNNKKENRKGQSYCMKKYKNLKIL